jgi:hypothetical protein
MTAQILVGWRNRTHDGVELDERQLVISAFVCGEQVTNSKSTSSAPFDCFVRKEAVRMAGLLNKWGVSRFEVHGGERIRFTDNRRVFCPRLTPHESRIFREELHVWLKSMRNFKVSLS